MKTEHMTELLQKYAENRLSTEEISALKKGINTSSDEELDTYLHDLWKSESGKKVDPNILFEIKQHIDKANASRKWSKTMLFRKAFRVAAIIAVPLFATFMYFMAERIPAPAASDMIVSVGAGERVSIVLPDGTKVNLNSETTLSYNVNDFNRKFREISMGGEAYFEVAKNEKAPFIIKTNSMDVKVLGTVFNLQARDEEFTTEINLIEGKVALTAGNTRQEVLLFANQRAVLDKRTGSIKVFENDPQTAAPWMRGELVFHATPIRNVLRAIERSYGVSINIAQNKLPDNDLFTGTFSINNLHETLEILRMHYRFDYEIKGKSVAIEHFRINKNRNMN
ncbi:MAG: FecR domain-containing protein [Paludibacter sp.]|nr:FecR domain-containing protein [Paludibacter sp.]